MIAFVLFLHHAFACPEPLISFDDECPYAQTDCMPAPDGDDDARADEAEGEQS